MEQMKVGEYIENIIKSQATGLDSEVEYSNDRVDVIIKKVSPKGKFDIGRVTVRLNNLDGEPNTVQNYLRAKTLEALDAAMKESKASA